MLLAKTDTSDSNMQPATTFYSETADGKQSPGPFFTCFYHHLKVPQTLYQYYKNDYIFAIILTEMFPFITNNLRRWSLA